MIPYQAKLWNAYLRILLNPPTSNRNNVASSKTPKTHASYLILMMIGSIIFQIDHSPYVEEFNQLIDKQNLDTLKKDLENLSIFYKKGFETLLVIFLTKVVTKYQIIVEKLNNQKFQGNLLIVFCLFWIYDNWCDLSLIVEQKIVTRDTIIQRRRILKQTVMNFHEFLVFQKFNGTYCSDQLIIRIIYEHMMRKKLSLNRYFERKDNSPVLKERHLKKPKHRLEDLSNEAHFELVFQSGRTNFEKDNKMKNKKILCRGTIRLEKNLFDFSSIDESDRSSIVTIWIQNHSCNQLTCILCFGWLWVPISYCVLTFFTILYDMSGCFVNSFVW